MDARKTSIKARLPSRHVTEGPERAPTSGGSTNAALHLPAIADECNRFDLLDLTEIFKKTPYIAGLKPGGRYVAKDIFEIGEIPLLMKTLLDHGHLPGDRLTVTGPAVAVVDADVVPLNGKLNDAERAERETKWKARKTNYTSGALWRCAQQIGPAVDGAVPHPGGAHEKQCYADI